MNFGTKFTFGREIWTAIVTVNFRTFWQVEGKFKCGVVEFLFPFIRHVY